MSTRELSAAARLRKAGVSEASRVAQLLAEAEATLGAIVEPVELLAPTVDPDLAVLQLGRLADAARDAGCLDIVRAVVAGEERDALIAVLGGSVALGDFLVRHPRRVADLDADGTAAVRAPRAEVRAALLAATGADPAAAAPVATLDADEATAAMRVEYRSRLMQVAAADLRADNPTQVLPLVAEQLANLADAALEAGLAIARASTAGHDQTRLAIMAMGKTGARELNYISDVDVIYVAEPAEGADSAASLAVATTLASAAARACDKFLAEPPLWTVDANLRPEGKDGALVRDIESHATYYDRWASTWEFQALLKARVAAGDAEVGAQYLDRVWPLVWQAAERANFVDDTRAMRRRVEQHIPSKDAEREIKLGAGGLRDVEFTIQLLQLVHGRADESLRVPRTLDALAALRDGGYVGRDQAARLDAAYRQLRLWEHRIQLFKMQRTHLMPADEEGLRRLARGTGFGTVDKIDQEWQRVRRDVRSVHLETYYRPMLSVVAGLSAGEASLDPQAARERLAAVGFLDPEAALRHIAALTEGVSRRASIQRQLLPAMIGWFAQGAEPDAGLLAFRSLSDQLRDTQWFLKLLRDSGHAAERLARLLSTSAYVTEGLLQSSENITWLDSDDELTPRGEERLAAEADALLVRSDDPDQAITALRGLRRRELVRSGAADVLGLVSAADTASTVTAVADAVVDGALRIALAELAKEAGVDRLPLDMAVIAMGRYGGREMNFASDADVMFVFEPHDGADSSEAHSLAQKVAVELTRLLQAPSAQPRLAVDADLRPEGRNGPLARSLESFAEYYGRWSEPWEAQALLRARDAAGDPGLRERFMQMVDGVRYPTEFGESALTHVRKLKARMEAERMPRGTDPRRHLKLGPGGLSDVEWAVQLLQLQHGHAHEALRTPLTLAALDGAREAGLIAADDAAVLAEAWSLATEVRGALALRGRTGAKLDVLPGDARELGVLATIIGNADTGAELEELYSRTARRARTVAEKVFYGWEAS